LGSEIKLWVEIYKLALRGYIITVYIFEKGDVNGNIGVRRKNTINHTFFMLFSF